jgi:hypothetical protein
MKRTFILLLLFIGFVAIPSIRAQVKQTTILDDLQTLVPGEGLIQIISDSRITELIGWVSPSLSIDENNFAKTNGFRIQVFMSNDPRTARGEIQNKGNSFKEAFPEIAIYTGYEAPNWKLLAGDFLTKEEAEVFRQKIKKVFPELGKEMYIVPDKINIQIQNPNN